MLWGNGVIARYLDCGQININTYKQRDIAGQYAHYFGDSLNMKLKNMLKGG